MINNKLYRDGLNWLNGANGRHEVCGLHGASGLRGLRCVALSFIIYYLSFIISLTLFSSCCSHSDDTPEPTPTPVVETGTPISFSGQEIESQDVSNGVKGTRAETRAGTPLSESVTSFTVWGYKNMSITSDVYGGTQRVFPGYRVVWYSGSAASTTTNTNGWEYVALQTSGDPQTIKYWDWDAKAYRFFAVTGTAADDAADLAANPDKYLPDGVNGNYGADATYWTSGSYKTYKITLSANASDATAMTNTPYFSRLWFSTGILPTYADKQFGKPVVLEFLKPYARVRFIFRYSYPREGINLTDVSFAPTDGTKKIARKGTVTVNYPLEGKEIREWYTMDLLTGDGSAELEKFEVDYDPEDDSKKYEAPLTKEGWYMVLPNNKQGSYTLNVTVNGKAKTCSVPEQYMQWLPGYSYTYVFKVTDQGGVEIGWVEYAVTPWSEVEADHTVYNW